MAIKIQDATEPVKVTQIPILIVGEPGAGKTTLAFTAKDPLLLDFDLGSKRAIRGTGGIVEVREWKDIAGMTASDVEPYSTLVIDTVGRCLDRISGQIMEDDPKMKTGAGQLTLQGYGALKSTFATWIQRMIGYGKDIVMLAHAKETTINERTVYRPDIAGGSYMEVWSLADAAGFLRKTSKNERLLSWEGNDQALGKNCAELDPAIVPHIGTNPHFLADLIQEIKDGMGRISEEAKKVTEIVGEWQISIDKAEGDPAGLTGLVEAANGTEELPNPAVQQVKALIARAAREHGLKWDGKAKAFKAEEAA